MPVVHGDARGKALDPRPREHAAAGDGGQARRGGARRPRRPRRARPLPRVPRVQGRVPGRRRRRALQERVPRRLLAPPRHAAARARDRPRPRDVGDGQPLRAAVEHRRASAAGRWINEQLLGIDRRRTPPAYARDTFARRFASDDSSAIRSRQPAPSPQSPAPGVVLFNDTFTNYNHPEIGVAAVDVLAAAGTDAAARAARLLRPPADLAGAARRSARGGAGERRRAVRRGCRAASRSCSSSRAACPPFAKTRRRCCAAKRSARHGWSPTRACCSRTISSGMGRRGGRPGAASRGRRPCCCTATVIRRRWACCRRRERCSARIPSCTVVDLDAGCCGMAGSFGYAREHYDVSRQIGERRLLPAARAMAPDAVLVAAGTSCREQVEHFTGVRAVHPAELLASLAAPQGELRIRK